MAIMQFGQMKMQIYTLGAAGTIARFLPGALAVAKKGNWVIEASNSMSERP